MIDQKTAQLWRKFSERYGLSPEQQQQFEHYALLVQTWNTKFNLTALTKTEAIVGHHFEDSLELIHHHDMHTVSMLADVGTGAGFPAIPLKIMFPHLKIVLIEVQQKKVQFLHMLAQELGLSDVTVSDLDWRTFLRTQAMPIDMFVARASLPVDELLRIYKPSSLYKHAVLVYWASQHWKPTERQQMYIYKQSQYQIDGKHRRYIFFTFPEDVSEQKDSIDVQN